MKKLLSALMILCMLSSLLLLASCGKGKGGGNDPLIVNEAVEKTNKLTTYAATMDMNISIQMAGMTMGSPSTSVIKAKNIGSENAEIYTHTTVTSMGETNTMTLYGIGDNFYMAMDDGGYKISADAADEMDLAGDSGMKELIKQIPESILKDAKLTSGDAGKSISLDLTPEQFKSIYGEFVEAIAETDLAGATVTSPKVEITVKDGYVVSYRIAVKISATVSGMEMVTDLDAKITFTQSGGNVTITPPEGYESFPEMPEM